MKITIIFYLFILIFHFPNLFSQEKKVQFYILNNEGKNIVNDSISSFDDVKKLAHGYLTVKKNKKYAIINPLGHILSPFEYDEIKYYGSTVLSGVRKDKLWGFINANAELIVPYQYTHIHLASTYRCKVSDERSSDTHWGLLDLTTGKELTPRIYNSIDMDKYYAKVRIDEKWGLIHKDGKEVVAPQYKYMSFGHFLKFKATTKLTVCYADKETLLLDTLGNILNTGLYFGSTKYSGSLIYSSRPNGYTTDKYYGDEIPAFKYAFVNGRGEYVTPFVYDKVETFGGGGIGKRDSVYCLIDSLGKEVFCRKYLTVNSSNGKLFDFIDGGEQFFNYQGEEMEFIAEDEPDDVSNPEDYRLLTIDPNTYRYGYRNGYGKFVISGQYRWANDFNNGRALVSKNGKHINIIDINNKVVFSLKKYKNITIPVSDKIFFEKEDGYIFTDLDGNQISPSPYEKIETVFHGTTFKGLRNGKWLIIDSDGKELTPCIYEMVGDGFSRDNLVRVKLNEKVGLVDTNTGEEVIPCKWHAIDLSNYDSLIHVKFAKKCGLVDMKGNIIIPPIYDEKLEIIGKGDDMFIKAKMDEKYGLLNKNGDVVIPFKNTELTSFGNLFIVASTSTY